MLAHSGFGQTVGYLDVNNVRAAFWSDGDMFWDKVSDPAYEWPQGSGIHTSFLNGLWIAGSNSATQNPTGGAIYYNENRDFYPGPLKNDGSASIDSNTMALYDRVWKMNKTEVDQFILCHCMDPGNALCSGYTVPQSIQDWPGNPFAEADGDHLAMDQQLAPYHDANGDGLYRWQDCDYPLIKCDQSLFFVYNDNFTLHGQSGMEPIGLEVRAMAYACSCAVQNQVQNNAVFLDLELNRGTKTLEQTFVGMFSDMDIRYASDDYVGTQVEEGYIYFYNGEAYDMEGDTLVQSQALVYLRGPLMRANGSDDTVSPTEISQLQDTLTSSGAYGVNGTGFGDGITDNERLGLCRSMAFFGGPGSPTSVPVLPSEFYGYLRGFWRDGTRMIYGSIGYPGGSPNPVANFIFPGDSDPLNYGTGGTPTAFDWSEYNLGGIANTPGDRRMISSAGPFTFHPGSSHTLSLAFVNARSTDPLDSNSLVALHNAVLGIKNLYYQNDLSCNGYTSVTEENGMNFSLYPNPSSDKIGLKLTSGIDGMLEVYDISGRKVIAQKITVSQEVLMVDISGLPAGIYTVVLSGDSHRMAKKFIRS